MTSNQGGQVRPQLRASDADRDAVVAALSEHFQAGRLTSEEFGERTGRALEARTLDDLGDLMTDLPAAQRPAAQPSPATPAGNPGGAGHPALPSPRVTLLAFAITALVLGAVGGHAGWDFWWIIPVLLVARLAACRRRAASAWRRN